jgi:hypothetical protein
MEGQTTKVIQPLEREVVINNSVVILGLCEAIQSAYGCEWVCNK